jgi:hypothetical protein
MARPKKGEPGYEEANARWRQTMKEKYGSATEHMARIGAIGGKNGHTGGFASSIVGKDGLTGKQRARVAGAVGGKKSTRAGIPNRKGVVPHITEEEVQEVKNKGWTWGFSRKRK